MKWGGCWTALALSAGMALAQGAPGAAPASAVAGVFPNGLRVNAELKTKLDTKSAVVGEAVNAVTTEDLKDHNTILLPKGSTLSGEVTGVQAAESRKSPSRLGVLFERAVTKKGEAITMHAAIVAVVANSNVAMDMNNDEMQPPNTGGRGGGGAGGGMDNGDMGGMGSMSPRTSGSMDAGMPSSGMGAAPSASAPHIVTEANGNVASTGRSSDGNPLSVVMPVPSGGQSNRVGSVLATPKGDLKLDSGTRVVLQIMN